MKNIGAIPKTREEGGKWVDEIIFQAKVNQYPDLDIVRGKTWEEYDEESKERYRCIWDILVVKFIELQDNANSLELELYDLRHKSVRMETRLDFVLSSIQEKDEKIQELEKRLCQQRQNYLDILNEENK